MSISYQTAENPAYRQIVELLGDYVMWGPLDPPAQEQAIPSTADSTFAAA